MKSLKPLLANLKSITLIVVLAGLILASGLIAAKTLLFTGTSTETFGGPSVNRGSERPAVNASSNDSGVKVNSGELNVSSDAASVLVWVNLNSGVYHCPNTRWYGNTKNGKYMPQKEAQSKGYRPAYGTTCS
jgi:hypothetical protein